MVSCSILNCKNRGVRDGPIRFFTFPKNEAVANAWLKYCKSKTNIRNGRVCSVHFLTSDYHKPLMHILMNTSPRNYRTLKPDAMPSLHINAIDQPVVDKSLDTVTTKTDRKELTNSNNVLSCSLQTQTQIETHCVETQTTERCSNTITIPLSEYEDLMSIKNKHQTINQKLSQMFTSGQIRCLVKPDKRRVRWSAEDIASVQ